jgi:NAD(P)-dependent dehydrogenase (short-subunit alcohol dehydrogenase family)
MQINNAVAFVTGANRGIGRSLVEHLLDRGDRRVYAAARETRSLATFVARDSKRIVTLRLDITRDEDVQAAVRAASDVNLLINNAGVANFGSVLDGEFAPTEHDMAINSFGTLRMIRAFAPILQRNKDAALVNLLTIVSLASMPMLGGYCASKPRRKLTSRGVCVHGVFPGPVDTDMIRAVELPKTSSANVAWRYSTASKPAKKTFDRIRCHNRRTLAGLPTRKRWNTNSLRCKEET